MTGRIRGRGLKGVGVSRSRWRRLRGRSVDAGLAAQLNYHRMACSPNSPEKI